MSRRERRAKEKERQRPSSPYPDAAARTIRSPRLGYRWAAAGTDTVPVGLAAPAAAQADMPETTLVKDINPGVPNSAPFSLTNVNGTLFFGASDGSDGSELWKVGSSVSDTTPPDRTIDSGPAEGGTIKTSSATFAFHGTAGDTASLEYKLDGGSFTSCTSPKTFSGLADGAHTVAFRAVDATANADPNPATRTFTVNASATTFPSLKIGKPKLHRMNGTASLPVTVPGPGDVEIVQTRQVKGASTHAKAAGKVTFTARARGAVAKKRKGKVKVTTKFTPDAGGASMTKHTRINMKRRHFR